MALELLKRGVAFTYPIFMVAPDGSLTTPVMATEDTKISKDNGVTFVNVTTLPTAANGVLRVGLSAAEMDAEIVIVKVVSTAATKAYRDTGFVIFTQPQTLAEIMTQATAAAANSAALPAAATTAAAVWDALIEGAWTFKQAFRLAIAALSGKGAGTVAKPYRDLDDTKDRIAAMINGTTGERTAVTRNVS